MDWHKYKQEENQDDELITKRSRAQGQIRPSLDLRVKVGTWTVRRCMLAQCLREPPAKVV